MKTTFVFTLCLTLLSCAPRPEKNSTPAKVDLPLQSGARTHAALWLSTTNYTTGGSLARLDLSSGELRTRVFSTGPDVQIFEDSNEGLLLLTRMQQDGISVLRGEDAKPVAHLALPEGSNPQWSLRAEDGSVWVASQDSNELLVLTADLKAERGRIDLSALTEENSPDGFAELAQVASIGKDKIAVTAQRLRRSPGQWEPEPRSGLAVIDRKTLAVDYTVLVDATNPIAVFATEVPVTGDTQAIVIGAGDLSSPSGGSARTLQFSLQTRQTVSFSELPHKILGAQLGTLSEAPALIAWYPNENRSCIQLGVQKLVCEGSAENGGYVFNRIAKEGDLLFVSHVGLQDAQLWIVPVSGDEIRKVPFGLPIESMSFGP